MNRTDSRRAKNYFLANLLILMPMGLRPVFHHKQDRTEGHLFITVLAYQLVQAIRRKLEAASQPMSWMRLREILSVQQRVTATFQQRDGHTMHVRKTTSAEPALRKIYDALAIIAAPGGVQKLIVGAYSDSEKIRPAPLCESPDLRFAAAMSGAILTPKTGRSFS